MVSSTPKAGGQSLLWTIPSSMRVHYWVKNLLVFAPILAAHRFDNDAWYTAFLVFFVFCCCSSGAYLINDWFDRAADREHRVKRFRPIAAGNMSLRAVSVTTAVLLTAGLFIGASVGIGVLLSAVAYCAVSTLYTFYIKRVVFADIPALIILHFTRLVAGALASGIVLSGWLVAFSFFALANLAIAKRSIEIRETLEVGDAAMRLPGRGYQHIHARVLDRLGLLSAFASVVILACYAGSETASTIYSQSGLLWIPVVLWVVWLLRIWGILGRGTSAASDPVVLAFSDPVSLGLITVSIAFIWAAS